MTDRFTEYLDRLALHATESDDVVGLAAFGSTAAAHRRDEWSDIDIAIVTAPGAEHRYRRTVDWLPDADRIVLSVTDRYDAVTVIFDDGSLIEYGAATPEDFEQWAGNSGTVLVDKADVAERVTRMLERTEAQSAVDVATELRLVIAKILIGAGRARRGELLTAGHNIRTEAVEHLLRAAGATLPHDGGHLDSLDPRRRFEKAFPELGARIARALEKQPGDAARTVLDIVDEVFCEHPDYPADAARVIRERHGW